MKIEELIEKSVFQSDPYYNGVFTQFLIPHKYSPLPEKDICGCWLLIFKTENLMRTWVEIYETFQQFILSHSGMTKVVKFEPFHELDQSSIIFNRGFNEAYTTYSYASFLERGDCRPNEWIIRDISLLNKALGELEKPNLQSQKQEQIISRLIDKSFIEPNTQLKWTDGVPWTLYLPPISLEEIEQWD
ncbi:hypothetical protein BKI52_15235 [marine bacterium AO1-C]|nr:hypothetical protein BKI52_15235 [marine bacterium AO1-C]